MAAVCTILGVAIAIWQLYDPSRDDKISRASQAIDNLTTSQDMIDRANRINNATESGTDYSNVDVDSDTFQDIVHSMNALEHIAAGVNHGTHDENVICNNLAYTIFKQVKAQLLGESGRLPSGIQWRTNKALFPADDSYEELRSLYKKWFPNGTYEDPC